MSEDGNKVKRISSADAKEQQTIAVVAVPLEIWDQVIKQLMKLPREDTDLLWSHITRLQPQQAPVQGEIS